MRSRNSSNPKLTTGKEVATDIGAGEKSRFMATDSRCVGHGEGGGHGGSWRWKSTLTSTVLFWMSGSLVYGTLHRAVTTLRYATHPHEQDGLEFFSDFEWMCSWQVRHSGTKDCPKGWASTQGLWWWWLWPTERAGYGLRLCVRKEKRRLTHGNEQTARTLITSSKKVTDVQALQRGL